MDFPGQDHRAIQLGTCSILQDKERMISEAIQSSSGLPSQFQRRPDNLCPRAWEQGWPKWWGLQPCLAEPLVGAGPLPSRAAEVGSQPQEVQKVGPLPQQAWRVEHGAKEHYSQSHGICLAKVFDFFGSCHPFPLSYFSLWEWLCLPYAWHTTVF